MQGGGKAEAVRSKTLKDTKQLREDIVDVDIDNVYCLAVLSDTVKIPAIRLNPNYREYVSDVLRAKFVNVCSKHGYIKDGTIKILRIDPPVIRLEHLNGDSYCNVMFQVWVCNPAVGYHMRGVVSKLNKFGILVQAGPVKCIITKSAVSSKLRSRVRLEDLNVGDIVVFKIHGVKFDIGDTTISVIGTVEPDSDILNAEINAIRSIDAKTEEKRRSANRIRKGDLVKNIIIDNNEDELLDDDHDDQDDFDDNDNDKQDDEAENDPENDEPENDEQGHDEPENDEDMFNDNGNDDEDADEELDDLDHDSSFYNEED